MPSAPSHPRGASGTVSTEGPSSHFRAHGRRPVRLDVVLRSERGDWERSATIVDIHIAGAGIETDDALFPGERVTVAFATPTLWDPLVLTASVAWAHPLRMTSEGARVADAPRMKIDALGRPRGAARAGLRFDYPTPDATLATFEMLIAIGFE